MQSYSGLAASPALAAPAANQRLHYRHPIHSLVYVTLDEGNGGIIRNLSQSGAAIQAVGALRQGQSIRMRFDLLNPRSRNKRIFSELVTSIQRLGLKKPITVAQRQGQTGYDLVCGQGRLEAFIALGQAESQKPRPSGVELPNLS